jgi:hypothetical protein
MNELRNDVGIILVGFFLCSSGGSSCVGERSVVGGGDYVDLVLIIIISLRYIFCAYM